MKMLFLFSEGFDTPGPGNHLMEALIADCLSTGIEVHLVESRRKRLYPDLPPSLSGNENLKCFVVDRPVVDKSRLVARYLEEMAYAFRCVARWVTQRDVDVVFVQSCPTVLYPIILVRILLPGRPIIYSVQDMFPGSAVNSGVMRSPVIATVFRLLQRLAYRLSTHITVISEDMKQKVILEHVPQDKISVIPNWYDDMTVTEVVPENNRFMKRFGLRADKFYVQYAGTMGYVFDYQVVLEAAKLLKDETDIVFQMIGGGSQRDVFYAEVSRLGLPNVTFYPLQPADMVSDVYSACSVCLIPLKAGVIGNSVPSKAALVMACNRTIVTAADEESQYFRAFGDRQMGIAVPPGDGRALAEAIRYLYTHPDVNRAMAARASEYAREHYSRTVNTSKYIDLFREIVVSNGRLRTT